MLVLLIRTSLITPQILHLPLVGQQALQHPFLLFRPTTLLLVFLLILLIHPQQENLVRVLLIRTGLLAPHSLQILLAGHQDPFTTPTVVGMLLTCVVIDA